MKRQRRIQPYAIKSKKHRQNEQYSFEMSRSESRLLTSLKMPKRFTGANTSGVCPRHFPDNSHSHTSHTSSTNTFHYSSISISSGTYKGKCQSRTTIHQYLITPITSRGISTAFFSEAAWLCSGCNATSVFTSRQACCGRRAAACGRPNSGARYG